MWAAYADASLNVLSRRFCVCALTVRSCAVAAHNPALHAVIEKARKVLVAMKKANAGPAEEKYKTALNTLMKYVGNVVANPDEEKFR